MKSTWYPLPIAVMLVILENNRVLLGQRKNTGFMDGFYALPGGRHDRNESLTAAAIREAHEELDIVVAPQDIQFANCINLKRPDDDSSMLYATFQILKYQGEIHNAEPHKCADLQFFDCDALPENMTDISRVCVEQTLEGVHYSERGWSEVDFNWHK